MIRDYCFRSRSFVATLVAFCLVSVSLWSFSAAAMSDVISDEIVITASAADAADFPSAEKICNHGCHAQIHLIGAEPTVAIVAPVDAEPVLCAAGSAYVPAQPADSLFRPPRHYLQA
jgi:hypothetical protein